MKKKKIVIICAVVALILCISLIAGHLVSPDIRAVKATKGLSSGVAAYETLEKAQGDTIFIENEDYVLKMNTSNTHFYVADKHSGKTYASVPEETKDFTPTEQQQSELIVTYYDKNSSKAQMNSYENSVLGQSFEIMTDGNVIRVNYSVQKSKEKIFVPEVISQETFEEAILANMRSGSSRRLKRYYTLYETDGEDKETKEMKQKYPILKKENVYILNESAGEHTYSEITGHFEEAGYNQSAYETELERLKLEDSFGDKMPAAFMIPVEYSLSEEGLVATILTDQITSDSGNYQLTNISLLPYFASCGKVEGGWFLVPDGSGAIIEFDEKQGKTYSQSIWGMDYAIESTVKANMMQNAGLPIFGFHRQDGAVLGTITGGAAVSTVQAEVYGNEITQSHIYTEFLVKAFDTSSIGEVSDKASFNIYAQDSVEEYPQVTYLLFDSNETTYSDMARAYQEVLVKKGILGERLSGKTLPIYMDFTGYEVVDESFLGIATQSKTVLSTLEEVDDVLKELEKREIDGVHIRLKAYGNEGLYHTLSATFDLDKCVGTKKELNSLKEAVNKNGGTLYLENNPSIVYSEGKPFKKMTHAVRSLKKTVVEAIDYDLVAKTNAEAAYEYYLMSPAYFTSLTEQFVRTFIKKCESADGYGYSWSDYGAKMWSDFHHSTPFDRTQAVDAANQAAKVAGETFEKVMTDGSNAYALPRVQTMLNMPLTCSDLNSESYSVPFYQMVIHGYKTYAGAPLNTGADMERAYLATIETGAGLYYSYYTAKEQPLKETQAGTLIYPTGIDDSYETMERQYREASDILNHLQGQLMTNHERVEEDVFVTTYEDGTKIGVNYSNKDVTVEKKCIPAKGFAVLERGQS